MCELFFFYLTLAHLNRIQSSECVSLCALCKNTKKTSVK